MKTIIPLSAYVEVDSSLVVSWKNMWHQMPKAPSLRHSILFSLSVYSELTEKKFTRVTPGQSLHVACVISIGSPSWFKHRNISNIAT